MTQNLFNTNTDHTSNKQKKKIKGHPVSKWIDTQKKCLANNKLMEHTSEYVVIAAWKIEENNIFSQRNISTLYKT